MEASLAAVGDHDLRGPVFETFFEQFPQHKPAFLNLEASSGRMINETLEMMLGLAEDARWVKVTLENFVDLHRNYGAFPAIDYASFIDLLLDHVAKAAGDGWTTEAAAAWGAQAARLKGLINASGLVVLPA
jgi:hypothetical protein